MDRKEQMNPNARTGKAMDGVSTVDYKDFELLRKFMTEQGKILPRRHTGANTKQQREIKRAIRRARIIGFVP